MSKVKSLLVKEPFKRVIPKGYYGPNPVVSDGLTVHGETDTPLFELVTQADFTEFLTLPGYARLA